MLCLSKNLDEFLEDQKEEKGKDTHKKKEEEGRKKEKGKEALKGYKAQGIPCCCSGKESALEAKIPQSLHTTTRELVLNN